ncbi:MAG: 5-bromo-4-chloroindolyl phosphate hydrolysis family protein [Erysipelotrichaceae bacterium]|nr:5-bromo-4-chloroindolyl phosphate hydrolysis family protein [Erysipelotrichaceae bacterium]
MLKPNKETIKKIMPSPKPYYAVACLWTLGTLFLPMYKLSSWLILAVISFAAYFLLRKFVFPDKETEIVVEKPRTYFTQVQQEFIENGTKSLKNIQALSEKIDNPALAADVSELVNTSDKILDYVYEHEQAASNMRKLVNYYLPTVEKLLGRYLDIKDQDAANVLESKEKIESIVKTTSEAFKNQLESLYDTDTLDINSEVKVLEQIYVKEGLIDPENK